MASHEATIQYWNDPENPCDHDKDTFWVKDAAEAAVRRFWLREINALRPFPETLTITVDRDRGVVVVSDT